MRSRFRRAVLAAVLGLAATVAVAPARAPAQDGAVTNVTVKMVEYRFLLSVRRVHTGTVVFTVVNSGELPHTFDIQSLQKVTPLIQPGRRTVMRVTFRKPGSYYYLCTVGAHVQYGMYGNLTVVK